MAADPGTATAELLERVRGGDRRALDRLIARFDAPLRRFLRRRLPASADDVVDDLVQETQVEAFRSLPTFVYRHDGSYLAWLYTIARRCLAREYERSRRRPMPLSLPEPGSITTERLMMQLASADTGPDGVAERAELLDLIAQALAELTEDRRDAIVLVYFEGRDPAEAARALGLSADAFRACLSRARRQLADVLDAALAP